MQKHIQKGSWSFAGASVLASRACINSSAAFLQHFITIILLQYQQKSQEEVDYIIITSRSGSLIEIPVVIVYVGWAGVYAGVGRLIACIRAGTFSSRLVFHDALRGLLFFPALG
jgi:hypothetical protein